MKLLPITTMNNSNLGARIGRYASAAALGLALLAGCGGEQGAGAPAATNQAPRAAFTLSGMVQAGGGAADATASAGSALVLDAGVSSDADGDAISYTWSIVSKPAASTLALANDSAVKLNVVPDVAGTYVFGLRARDSKGAFADKNVTLEIGANAAPVQNVLVSATFSGAQSVKAAQALHVGSALVFDPSGSSDADGDAVTVSWTLTAKPAASAAAISLAGGIGHLQLDVAGQYQVRARGTDPHGAYSDTVYVYNAANHAPQVIVLATPAAAQAAHTAYLESSTGYVVALDGAATSDLDGDTVSYAWTLVSRPAGSAAALSSTNGQSTQIVPDVRGDYVVRLSATDGKGGASVDLTTIGVNNTRPVASISSGVEAGALLPAGASKRVSVNASVTLASAASVDPDGDALAYSWSIDQQPEHSTATLVPGAAGKVVLTPDLAGTYGVRLRATDSTGAYSEQVLVIAAGNALPVAVLDHATVSTVAGNRAQASAARSFDEDGDVLGYSWEIDARPAASRAVIAAPASPALSFTPDVAGTYIASVTVSDGVNASVAYVVIKAVAAAPSAIALPFKPLEARYSKNLDKLVATTAGPDALKIIDPFSGVIKTVLLPAPASALSLSADGKLAAVLHDGALSLVQLETASLLRTSPLGASYTEAFITNSGLAYLAGQATQTATAVQVINAYSGVNLTASLGLDTVSYIDAQRGIYSPLKNRAFLTLTNSGNSAAEISYFDINPVTGAFGAPGSSARTVDIRAPLFLSENEDLLFTEFGTYFRTDTLQHQGTLAIMFGRIASMSHSAANDEALVVQNRFGMFDGMLTWGYSMAYQRFTGAALAEQTQIALPLVNGSQSYAVKVFHSANGNHVVVVQTGSAAESYAGASYFLLVR
jgi:hypothetical protein